MKFKPICLYCEVFLLLILNCNSFFTPCWAWGTNPPSVSIDGFALADNFQVWNTNVSDIPLGPGSNSSTFVVTASIRGLSLICNASYPVEWTFHREKWGRQATWQTSLVNSRGSDPQTLAPLWYSVEIRFLGHNTEMSGNYTCQKYGQPEISKSVFIFWEGSSPPYLTLLQSGSYRRTVMSSSKSGNRFKLPCTVSRPDISVKLFRTTSDNKTLNLSDNEHVKFDPAIGFTVSELPDPFGIYKCMVGEPDDEDIIEFEVKDGEDPPKPEFEDYVWHGAKFNYDPSKRQFACCSSPGNKPPKIGHYYCSHPITCQLQKHALHKLETSSHNSIQDSCSFFPVRILTAGVIRCKGTDVDSVREYFFPMTVSPYTRRRSNVTETPYYSWGEADPEKMLTLTNFTGPFYVGEKRRFLCRASRFYYSQGIHWKLIYQNETLYVKGNQTDILRKHPHGIFMQGNYATLEVYGEIGLKEIVCNAPVWNSTNWGVKSLSVEMSYPTAPTIDEGNSTQTLTWPTNIKNQTLTCKFSGTPRPFVTWTRDGKTVRWGIKNNNFSSTINVSRTDFSESIYICNVTNVGGVTAKIFHIYIRDTLSGWKIALYVLGGIITIGAFIGAFFALYKNRQQKEAIRRLANVAFKDVNDLAAAQNQVENGNVQANNTNNVTAESFLPPPSNGTIGIFGDRTVEAEEFGRYQKM